MTSFSVPDVNGVKLCFEIIDGLRGVAATLVVIFHLTESSPLLPRQEVLSLDIAQSESANSFSAVSVHSKK